MACEKKTAAPAIPSVEKQSTIRVGLLPNETGKNLDLLKSELSKKLSLDVEVRVATSYQNLADEMKNAQVDFAFFPPLVAIQAERDAGAKILLKKVYGSSEFYWSAIVVKAKSPFKKVSDLAKKRFAFVDPKSTSGFLYPRALLKKAGVDVKELQTEFLGTHTKALEALKDGKADAVGVWVDDPAHNKGAWDQVPGLSFKDLRILAISDPIPADAFTVREKLYAEQPSLVLKVMEAMISLSDGPHSVLKEVLDVDRLSTATSRHYDTVRAFENDLKD